MVQTSFRTDSGSADERIVVPIGIIRLIRSGFKRYGLHDLFNNFKDSGVPLGTVIENICTSCLCEDYSMKDWDAYVNRSPLRKQFFCGDHDVRRWTLQRGLDRIGDYLEEVVEHLTKVLRTLDPDAPTHVNVDGSHIKRNGSKGSNVSYGEGGGSVQLQNQFMTASLIGSCIPVSIELYPGNVNDPTQYMDFIPQLLFHLKAESLIVMDNGGSGSKILDEIKSFDCEYLTRASMNKSNDTRIVDECDRMIYVGMNAACIKHTFGSSNRTTYLFFSADSYAASLSRAEKAVKSLEKDRIRAQNILTSGNPDSFIKIDDSPFFTVEYENAKFVMTRDPWIEMDVDSELKKAVAPRNGWFKLECSFEMDPRLALVVYRHRVDVEHMISVLKSVVNLDPLRVWSEGSTRGRLVIALVTDFILSMFIKDLEPRKEVRNIDGKPVETMMKPSGKTVIKELRRYEGLVTPYPWGGFNVAEIRDKGVCDDFVKLFDEYDKTGSIKIPENLVWRHNRPAQWDSKEKNSKNLAMSIAQHLSENIFPSFMARRCAWKTIDPSSPMMCRRLSDISGASSGAPGLVGRGSYYPGSKDLFGKKT